VGVPGPERFLEQKRLGVGTVESNDCAKIEVGHRPLAKSGKSWDEKQIDVVWKAKTRTGIAPASSDKLSRGHARQSSEIRTW
jgi:hypothetical protein